MWHSTGLLLDKVRGTVLAFVKQGYVAQYSLVLSKFTVNSDVCTFIHYMFYDIWCLSNLIFVAVYFLMHHFMSKINKSSYLHATLFININICNFLLLLY